MSINKCTIQLCTCPKVLFPFFLYYFYPILLFFASNRRAEEVCAVINLKGCDWMVLSMGTGSNEFVALIWLRDLLGFQELLKLSLEYFIFFLLFARVNSKLTNQRSSFCFDLN